jgi:hypothetical protein
MKVGSLVVCVDSFILPETREQIAKDCPNFVVKGKHYTIRAIRDFDFVQSVLVEELTNPILYFNAIGKSVESGFKISRFAELQEDEVLVQEEVEEFVN